MRLGLIDCSRGTSTCCAQSVPALKQIKVQMRALPHMNAPVINKPAGAGKQLFTRIGRSQLYGGSARGRRGGRVALGKPGAEVGKPRGEIRPYLRSSRITGSGKR